jgi:hypothetical protein
MARRKPETYTKDIKDTDVRYRLILDEYTVLYPNYKMHPEIPSTLKAYADDEGNMHKLQTDLFLLRNNLQKDITGISSEIKKINDQIVYLDKENAVLIAKLDSIQGSKDGAKGMFQDSQQLYNQYLLGNWLMVLAFAGIAGIYKSQH